MAGIRLNSSKRMPRGLRIVLLALLLVICARLASSQSLAPIKVRVNDVELHYIEAGQGDPLILLHGGAFDYRAWAPQWDVLTRKFRVISYSRRYHYPNSNTLTRDHSALVDAEDLAALIGKLKLRRVHLVGHSYGGYTALVLALKHPEMVRTLVLAEPPVHQSIRALPDGEQVYQEFIANTWEPVCEAFKKGDTQQAMRTFVDGHAPGRFDSLPSDVRAALMQNASAIEAVALSSNPFPNLSKDELSKLRVPVLIVTGERTIKIHKLVNEELSRVIPNVEKVTISGAGHGSPRENPLAFNAAVLKFLAAHEATAANFHTNIIARRAGKLTALPGTHGGE
jgi:pimeloyl-ACP methyl ester carboxylesterase